MKFKADRENILHLKHDYCCSQKQTNKQHMTVWVTISGLWFPVFRYQVVMHPAWRCYAGPCGSVWHLVGSVMFKITPPSPTTCLKSSFTEVLLLSRVGPLPDLWVPQITPLWTTATPSQGAPLAMLCGWEGRGFTVESGRGWGKGFRKKATESVFKMCVGHSNSYPWL